MPDEPTVSHAPSDATSQTARGMFSLQGWLGKWLLLGCVIALAIGLYWIGPQLWALLQDEQALEAWVISLGWMGPLALVALNAIQIIVAPVPGYVLQFAAGFLFGPLWGGIWGSLGLLLGASLAFWLTRIYGRPLAGRLVGNERLDKWQRVSHSHSTLIWFIILLSPTGDIPYFLAGLARVSFIKIFVITVVVRVPSTFIVAAAGAGVVWLTWWQVALLLVGLVVLFALFLRYQEQIMRWTDRHVQRRVEQAIHHDA